MPDVSTTALRAAVSRIADDMVENLAVQGLRVLKKTLDEAGVPESLKQYEVYSHVSGNSVIFEIIVDADKVMATDPRTMAAISTESSKLRKQMMAKVSKSFEMGSEGPRRVVRDARTGTADARSRASDSRKPALDARRRMGTGGSAAMDQIENPRGMELTPSGKLSVTLERSTVSGKFGLKLPKDSFQGIMGEFMTRIEKVLSNRFVEEMSSILASRSP